MSTFFDITKLRFLQETEVDYDSPISEELKTQIKENNESLFHLLYFTGSSGTATTAPTSERLMDANSTWLNDVHNGRTLVMLSGAAAGKFYTIDDGIGATSTGVLICTGDNLSGDGVASGDKYKIFYNLQTSTGHSHDGINTPRVVLADGQVATAKIADQAVLAAKIGNGNVTEVKMAAASVNAAALKTTTAAQSVSVGSQDSAQIALTGGTYAFITWSADNAGQFNVGFGHGNTAAGIVGFANDDTAAARSAYVDTRYVQASPPYDLGDGEILMFIYVLMDSSGNIKGISVGADPIWAHHGPTNVVPEYYIGDKPFCRYRELDGKPFSEAIKDLEILAKYVKGENEILYVPKEINNEIKNKDMNIIPHPYINNNLSGLTPILLDPVSPIMERLSEMEKEVGAKEILTLIENGHFDIGNDRLNRKAPSALMPVSFKWK